MQQPLVGTVVRVGRIALVLILSIVISVTEAHAQSGKLTGWGLGVMVAGIATAVVGGNPRSMSDKEQVEAYASCYDNDGHNCYERNYTDPFSGIEWDPNGKVIGIGLLMSAAGTLMMWKGLTGPHVVVAPQRRGASVTVMHGW